jgi:hypothetical protein
MKLRLICETDAERAWFKWADELGIDYRRLAAWSIDTTFKQLSDAVQRLMRER